MRIKHNGQIWQLVNIYAPNFETEQLEFFDDLHKMLVEKDGKNSFMLIGGDWNVVKIYCTRLKGWIEKGKNHGIASQRKNHGRSACNWHLESKTSLEEDVLL